ncbi:MAG: isochorismate synthase MenF [Acidimicrobiia bacterium]
MGQLGTETQPMPLIATTKVLDEPVDLNDVARGDGVLFVRDGIGIAGRGVAAVIADHQVMAALGQIAWTADDADAPPPVAIGRLPFHPGAAGSLTIPAVSVVKDSAGRCWITEVSGGRDDPATCGPLTAGRPQPSAASFSVRPGVAIETYLSAVSIGRDAVRDGRLTKVVIARDIWVESDQDLDVHAILLRLRASFGSSFRYSVDGFVGASPELLVERRGDEIRSHPLAGTAPRTGDPATDARLAAELIASTKNQVEHRVVIDMVHDTLLPWCSYLDEEAEPSIVTVANVQHLGTAMEGRLSKPAPAVMDLAKVLSPTPALGGFPRDRAIDLIETTEGFDRGFYGGAVGWVDARGDGTWAVAIRCAEISANRAHLFAGGGIVADSEPLAELAETQAKFQAMLSAIVRP